MTPVGLAESVARKWNEQNLAAIRIDFPHPPVHARNLFHVSVAMYDAWAAYDSTAVGYLHRERAEAFDPDEARREAISFAAYRVLVARYGQSVSRTATLTRLWNQMIFLGYDPSDTSSAGDRASALGNRVAATVLTFADSDQSNEALGYQDFSYSPANAPLILQFPGTTMLNPNRWQPLAFEFAFTQNGLVADEIQTFLGSHWGDVRPFAMERTDGETIYNDPGSPPELGGSGDLEFKEGNLVVLRRSRDLDPSNGVMLDISPASRGNSSLGTNDGTGYAVNPKTGQPYEPSMVPLGDYGRVLAEFWADGPDSETPPGHWNALANEVGDHALFERRIAGEGPVIDALEWDVKTYFVLNAANHDAAIAAWGCKTKYDYVRPISSIRYMAGKGQSSDPQATWFHPEGIPLEPGLVELVTSESSSPGERHEGLGIGQIVVKAWGGEPADPATQFTGAKWIPARDWLPYQRDTFVTPAFAGYVSGHSAFSRASAEVLTLMTGDPCFPGGLASFTARKNEFLHFEQGPSVDVTLQWATSFDASDEAGISRLYGGIHDPVDDGPGRVMGSKCGQAAYAQALTYFDGSVLTSPVEAEWVEANASQGWVRWKAERGMVYSVEVSDDLVNFVEIGGPVLATDVNMELEVDQVEERKFYRVKKSG
ncbi:MAG: vanadium-dependent haloperoxidase [Verrucomicrobiota bacterium]